MLDLETLEMKVKAGYSIMPDPEGREIVKLLREMEAVIDGHPWEDSATADDAIQPIFASFIAHVR